MNEQRIHEAEATLFAAVGADVEQSFVELERSGGRLRVLSHGDGPPVLLLHGVSLSAAVWAPLFTRLPGFRLVAVDLPGHGVSDPMAFRRGQVRAQAARLIDDVLDALGCDAAPVIGHSLGGMFALWHMAAGSDRIPAMAAVGQPAVALPGVTVRMPLSALTVRGLGYAVLRAPGPPAMYRRMLAQGLGAAEVAAAPDGLIDALRLASRRPENARTVASLMHAIDRFRRPRPESVLTGAELASIDAPTTFILGSDDPYVSVERARPSIEAIPAATLHEVPAGHGPWLVDPDRVAALITEAGVLSPLRNGRARRPSSPRPHAGTAPPRR